MRVLELTDAIRAVLTEYVGRFDVARPCRGLDLQPPIPAAQSVALITSLRRVERTDVLGGRIHESRHAAWAVASHRGWSQLKR
jgi:hypothetical protein